MDNDGVLRVFVGGGRVVSLGGIELNGLVEKWNLCNLFEDILKNQPDMSETRIFRVSYAMYVSERKENFKQGVTNSVISPCQKSGVQMKYDNMFNQPIGEYLTMVQ